MTTALRDALLGRVEAGTAATPLAASLYPVSTDLYLGLSICPSGVLNSLPKPRPKLGFSLCSVFAFFPSPPSPSLVSDVSRKHPLRLPVVSQPRYRPVFRTYMRLACMGIA